MKPFSTMATPRRDIVEGKFTKDTFAASLWEVFKGRAPEEYCNSDTFFERTHITEGMNSLLNIVERRLKGEDGYPVVQLQTPFGGGKTHSMLALYHKAKELGARVVVIDGHALSPKETIIWEEIERQLTGEVNELKGEIPPAGEKLRNFFLQHQPLLILMDEILEYTIGASGIRVENSTLASQVLGFMRYLTDTIRDLNKTVLLIAYPSKSHYDEYGQQLLNLLQLRSGRVSTSFPPVRDEEIYDVIRKRLFRSVDQKVVKKEVEGFLDYAENEKLFSDRSSYRENFLRSFPFQPEVIDVLYKRWGSFPLFERTRGVLYLLASVVHSLKASKIPFIKLADFDLNNDRIRSTLIDVVGSEYNSIIAKDITSQESGAKKVDRNLPESYFPFSLGTKVATAIFMCSFSAGPERGATINDIKLSCAELDIPSAVIVDVIDKLKDPFTSLYLDFKGGKYLFTTQIPLRRILSNKMEDVKGEDVKALERELLAECFERKYFELLIWPKSSRDVPDTKGLKLVVMPDEKENCKEFLERCGESPRVYRNTLVFLCPLDTERQSFENLLKRKIAWQHMEKDESLPLTEKQMKEVEENKKKEENEAKDQVRSLYRIILLPSKDGFKEIDLGIPTYGAKSIIDKEIYERLRSESEILERLSPLPLRDKYLKDKEYVETKNVSESFFKTPGEIRITSDEVLKNCIKEGIKQGLFGVGNVENGRPICRHFKSVFSPELVEGETLIKAELCQPESKEISDEEVQQHIYKIQQTETGEALDNVIREIPMDYLSAEQKKQIDDEITRQREKLAGPSIQKYHNINLKLDVSTGKLADIVKMSHYLKNRFNQVKVKIEISGQDGEIEPSDYEDKIKETIKQAGTIEEEKVE